MNKIKRVIFKKTKINVKKKDLNLNLQTQSSDILQREKQRDLEF